MKVRRCLFTKINLSRVKKQISDDFESICHENLHLFLELSKTGELILMSPTGGETGSQNARLITYFGIWNESSQLGELFDSSTCFQLPNLLLKYYN